MLKERGRGELHTVDPQGLPDSQGRISVHEAGQCRSKTGGGGMVCAKKKSGPRERERAKIQKKLTTFSPKTVRTLGNELNPLCLSLEV